MTNDKSTRQPDEVTLSQWLDERAAGEISAENLATLESLLKKTPDLRKQAQLDYHLNGFLRISPVDVREGFVEELMALLRRSRSSARSYLVAAALLFGLVTCAALLASLSGSGGSVLSPLATIGDFLVTSGVAAAGLLGASWEGVGSVVGDWVKASVLNAIVFGGLVLSLNLLLFSLIRRRRARVSATSDRSRND